MKSFIQKILEAEKVGRKSYPLLIEKVVPGVCFGTATVLAAFAFVKFLPYYQSLEVTNHTAFYLFHFLLLLLLPAFYLFVFSTCVPLIRFLAAVISGLVSKDVEHDQTTV